MLIIRSLFVSIIVLMLAFAGSFGAMAAGGPDLRGRARVIDGDTLAFGRVRVRIFGIDAPEAGQTCPRADHSRWACGAWATAQMQARFGGRDLTCTPKDRDRYGRVVATCRDAGGTDVGAALTGAGAAMAYRRYSRDYVADERRAEAARRGIWAGPVTSPADFRAQKATRADTARAGIARVDVTGDVTGADIKGGACAIKGNISRGGKIFHSPGQRDYPRTRINPGADERWFCSAAEARAAGWRPARR
jgi:endonuclease YncB( thermonuclease family)